mgnify:CR=1 FL=1
MKRFRAGVLMSLLGCSSALLPLAAAAAENLRVAAGETHQLSPSEAHAHFASWTLGDGATLVLPAGPEQWRLQVDRARIGQGVHILGRGAAGANGRAGETATGRADACHAGRAGGSGLAGDPGAAGASLDLSLGIDALGSLAVDLSGGTGGQGGAGGGGQDGGVAQQCSGGDGGAGGGGGDGGDGGNGGSAHIRYSYLSDGSAPGDVPITVVSEGGNGGAPGAPGRGGAGSEGKYIQARTLSGSQKWVDGGAAGHDGQPGKAGRAGSKGQVAIEQDLNQRLNQLLETGRIASPPPAAPRAPADRTEELERKLDAALRRIDALEKHSP